jgi:hypothetical protein
MSFHGQSAKLRTVFSLIHGVGIENYIGHVLWLNLVPCVEIQVSLNFS